MCFKTHVFPLLSRDFYTSPEEAETFLFKSLSHVVSNYHRYSDESIFLQTHTHHPLFRYHPSGSVEDCLTTVLTELKRHHIGVPPHAASLLRSDLTSEANLALTQELEDMHAKMGEHWTKEKKEQFLQERKKMHRFETLKTMDKKACLFFLN